MRTVSILTLHCIIASLVWTISGSEDRSKWADPNDMINFDHASKRMLNKKTLESAEGPSADRKDVDAECNVQRECPKCDCESCEKQDCPPCPPPPECVCEQAALPLLKKYTQSLLTHFRDQLPGVKPEEYNVRMTLSGDQIKIFEKFVTTGDQRHVHDVHDILAKMIDRVAASRLGAFEKLAQTIEHKIGMSLDRLIQFFSLAALASIVLLIEVRLQIAWRRRVSQLIVLMFVISVPWTWYDLYKEAEIKQESKVSSLKPEDCNPGAGGYWRAMLSYVTLQEDKCMQYYESLMVDPLVKVPPTKAIAVTFVRFFMAPLKDVGTAFSEFLRALLVDLPLTLYPFAMAMVCLFLFLLLVFWNRYSVRLPFYLLTIEPSANVAISNSSVHQAVTDANQQTLTQLEQLQTKLEAAQHQLTDKLQHLEKVQQLAIEYSQSFGPPSPTDSPTIPCRATTIPADPPTIPADPATIPSRAQPSGTQSVGAAMVLAKSDSDKNKTEIEKSGVATRKDKVSQDQQEKPEKGLGSYRQGGDGDLGATPMCASVGNVVDTLLPDGVIEARSST